MMLEGNFVRRARTGALIVGTAVLCLPLTASRAPVSVVVTHHVRIPAGSPSSTAPTAAGWASSNWSGYAITGGPFRSATARWVVPSVGATSGASFSATWVGIDGFNDNNLIQTGTEQDYYSGRAHYYAWWEILPAAETVINSIAVQPGDLMKASLKQGTGGSWTISITDVTRSQSFTTHHQYSAPLSSAEWIQEAPSVGSRTATLAHYKSFVFDPGTANGVAPGLTAADGGLLIQNGHQVSTPSNPDSDRDGFRIAYGSATPAAPSS